MKKLPILLLAVPLIAGCGAATKTEAAPTSGSTTPTQMTANFPVRWIPTASLDLSSPDGTFVRAMAESMYHIDMLSYPGAAPGYLRANNGIVDWERYSREGSAPGPRHPLPPGTTYMFVVDFPPDLLNTPLSNTLGAAAVCIGSTNTGSSSAYMFFTFERTGRTPPAHQVGPLASPTTDVFGGWTGIEKVNSFDKPLRGCEQPPQPIPQTNAVLPPSPGWPAASQ